jgi:hypothetical protein
MKTTVRKKVFILAISMVFLSVSLASGFKQPLPETTSKTVLPGTLLDAADKTVPITFSIYGKNGIKTQSIDVSTQEAMRIADLFYTLKDALTTDPNGKNTKDLQTQFLTLLKEHNAIPARVSTEEILSLLQPPPLTPNHHLFNILPFENKASEWFCNFATTGSGAAFPIIILPRFIPFVLTPIPRAFVYWSTPDGITSVGGLMSQTGFVAFGQQKGVALGFWGIGFSIFLPPINQYGIFGYALYTSVSADYFEFYPPNNPPEITQTDPVDGQQMVPVTTTELRFSIHDEDKEAMSYSVITEPDIGSGSGGLKPDGIYAIPVSGLESLTTYTWHIEVTDGKDTVTKILTFTTEPAAPILSNPLPPDGERDVPLNLSQLRFTLKDYQGDPMDYTVETSPNIGSAQAEDVDDGTYTVPISGLAVGSTYRWYVNVTDGVYWVRKVFSFETGYPTQFDPFDYGWQYRKQIMIDHTLIPEDMTHFPLLISTSDSDLASKAQSDGGDILFMHDIGVSIRLYHDLESYTSTSGALVAWLDIPSLSSTSDTVFYMYYGNPDCIDQGYPKKTWDANFKAVWHMNDATLSTISDSTSNMFIGTKVALNEPQQSSGKVGPDQDFDGVNDYIQFSNSVIPTGPKTISAWIDRHSTGWFGVILASSTGISSLDAGTSWSFLGVNDTIQFVLGNGNDPRHYMTLYIPHPSINSWHYYTMTYDGASLKIYIDGALVGSTMTTSGAEAQPTYNLRMGETNHPSYHYCMNAELDEIQISNVVRSDIWIHLSYDMMMNPLQYITIGPEVHSP